MSLDLSNAKPLEEVSQDNNFDALPEGNYRVVIEDIEEKTSKKGHLYKNIKLKVLDEAYKNRVLWDSAPHGNPEHNEWALAKLKRLCEAAKVDPSNYDDYKPQGKLVIVEVGKAKDSYNTKIENGKEIIAYKNVVKNYLATGGAPAHQPKQEISTSTPSPSEQATFTSEELDDEVPF